MTRAIVHGIVFGSLVALGACAREAPAAKDTEARGLPVGEQIFPTSASVTEYTTWGKERSGADVQRTTHADLSLGFAGRNTRAARQGIEISVGTGGGRERHSLVLPNGRPSIRPDLPMGSVDVLELLPAAGAHLELHQPYETPDPDTDYILSEADHNRLVLWQPMIGEPTGIVTVGDKTLVRVEGRGVNRLHFVDDDGSIRSSDLGTAYLSVVDLVSIPGQGWQVLRFARVSDVEGADKDPAMSLQEARTHEHATFVVCASRMDVAGGDLAQLHATLVDEVPEFAHCATK